MSDDWKLLNTSTASGSSEIEFTSLTGYKIFKFVFVQVHGSASGVDLRAEFSAGTGYADKAKTTTFFRAAHKEDGSATALSYQTGHDLAQSNSAKHISRDIGNDADHNISGELLLFNPQSTTYVKHFYGRSVAAHSTDIFIYDSFFAGYVNTDVTVDAVKFSFTSGNVDDGVFKQYGLVAS